MGVALSRPQSGDLVGYICARYLSTANIVRLSAVCKAVRHIVTRGPDAGRLGICINYRGATARCVVDSKIHERGWPGAQFECIAAADWYLVSEKYRWADDTNDVACPRWFEGPPLGRIRGRFDTCSALPGRMHTLAIAVPVCYGAQTSAIRDTAIECIERANAAPLSHFYELQHRKQGGYIRTLACANLHDLDCAALQRTFPRLQTVCIRTDGTQNMKTLLCALLRTPTLRNLTLYLGAHTRVWEEDVVIAAALADRAPIERLSVVLAPNVTMCIDAWTGLLRATQSTLSTVVLACPRLYGTKTTMNLSRDAAVVLSEAPLLQDLRLVRVHGLKITDLRRWATRARRLHTLVLDQCVLEELLDTGPGTGMHHNGDEFYKAYKLLIAGGANGALRRFSFVHGEIIYNGEESFIVDMTNIAWMEFVRLGSSEEGVRHMRLCRRSETPFVNHLTTLGPISRTIYPGYTAYGAHTVFGDGEDSLAWATEKGESAPTFGEGRPCIYFRRRAGTIDADIGGTYIVQGNTYKQDDGPKCGRL